MQKDEQITKRNIAKIIANEGFVPIATSFFEVLVFIFLGLEGLALLCFCAGLFFAFIFRNPERIAKSRQSAAILAPSDGVVVDILQKDGLTSLRIKTGIFDVGVLRAPMFADFVKAHYRHGLFIADEDAPEPSKEVLNTRHSIEGICDGKAIYRITLLPEAWNKATIYECEDAFAGDRVGFMKCGYLIFDIYAPCELCVDKGSEIFGGESVLGQLEGENPPQDSGQDSPQNSARGANPMKDSADSAASKDSRGSKDSQDSRDSQDSQTPAAVSQKAPKPRKGGKK